MAKKSVGASNARHSRLADLNAKKWLHATSEKETIKYEQKSAYHRSVINSQQHCGRVLTQDERKRVFKAVENTGGRGILVIFKK